jgi:hypothetical protein
LRQYSSTGEGLKKLHRLAEIINFHKDIVNMKLSRKVRGLYYQVLHDNLGAIAILLSDIVGEKDIDPFEVHTFGDPCYKAPIRLSPAHAKFVRDEFQAVKEVGLAKNKHTPWASPCFPVPKPRSEKLRLVIDFRGLNMQTRRSSFPIPHIFDIVNKVGRFCCWAKIDLKSGFW